MFIKGLYEVQRETPYLFQNIQGLDALSSFNPSSGLRLKDVTISIDCIEGLSLKIKTLMELYRKAAWDDVWQRWVLPENLREFKMIIYVYERRIFHTGMNMTHMQSLSTNDNESNNQYTTSTSYKNFLHDIGRSIKDAFTTD